jgi:hypothetical protein
LGQWRHGRLCDFASSHQSQRRRVKHGLLHSRGHSLLLRPGRRFHSLR